MSGSTIGSRVAVCLAVLLSCCTAPVNVETSSGGEAASVQTGTSADRVPTSVVASSSTTVTVAQTTSEGSPVSDPLVSGVESPTEWIAVSDVGDVNAPKLQIGLAFESRVADVTAEELRLAALAVLGDERSWSAAGFSFIEDQASRLRVVLAEGPEVDLLCAPLQTRSTVSCQNGSVVALNADRWRTAVSHWDAPLELYRTYLINHEVGHLIGMRHPTPRCPSPGAPAGVMEQQTRSLEGCSPNGWPRPWEIEYAQQRPAVIGPDPSWGPPPVPVNRERE